MSFEKTSAFHEDWGKDPAASAHEVIATAEGQAREAMNKQGLVQVPRKDLEDIVHELRISAMDVEDDPFVAEQFEELADRLSSYFPG